MCAPNACCVPDSSCTPSFSSSPSAVTVTVGTSNTKTLPSIFDNTASTVVISTSSLSSYPYITFASNIFTITPGYSIAATSFSITITLNDARNAATTSSMSVTIVNTPPLFVPALVGKTVLRGTT